jgi:hypothetical protein
MQLYALLISLSTAAFLGVFQCWPRIYSASKMNDQALGAEMMGAR